MQEQGKKGRRQLKIVDMLGQRQFMPLDAIAAEFGTTRQTIRRDLIALEENGIVRRLHGGVILAAPQIDPTAYRRRRVENIEAKRRIAARVAALIPDGTSIFLDTGTTCETVAQALVDHRDLRGVTHSLRSATILSESDATAVAIPGGFVRSIDASVFGQHSVGFIAGFRFDTAVISVSGIDEFGEMCDDDQGEAEVVRAAMGRAARTILAVDSSKFSRRAMVCIGPITETDIVVTDAAPSAALRAILDKAGVAIEIV